MSRPISALPTRPSCNGRSPKCFRKTAVAAIRTRVDYLSGTDAVERMFGVELQPGGKRFDIAIHFSGAYLIVEAEPSVNEPDVNSGEMVRLMLGRVRKTNGLTELAQEAAGQLKILNGFDRVMVYRFHPDGSGEVIAEIAAAGLEPFLGLHYPASDIPKQARILYQRNWLRIIAMSMRNLCRCSRPPATAPSCSICR